MLIDSYIPFVFMKKKKIKYGFETTLQVSSKGLILL